MSITANNLTVSQTATAQGCRSSFLMTSGQWYWEVTNTTASSFDIIGIVGETISLTADLTTATLAVAYYASNGNRYVNGSAASYGATYTTNDVIGVAVDITNNTVTFYKNGVSQGTITGLSLSSGAWYAANGNANNGANTKNYNFGQRPFTYTPPSGFRALCTANLPSSAVVKGNTQMDATLFTGTGATQTITNAGSFRSDIVWIKSYSNVTSHYTFDAIGGAGLYTSSDISPLPSATDVNTLTSFNSNGFTLGSGATGCNSVGDLEVAWQWQAGSSAVTNTTGSITTTVRANPTAGISIVGYTGTGVVDTLGHGLGTAPALIMSKTTASGSGNWLWYHQSLGPTQAAFANNTAVPGTNIVYWNNTAPASSVYTVLSSGGTNVATRPYFAYVFAQVPGFSKFDRYTGNGAADGPFVYLGFRPKLILIKRTDTTSNWIIWDSVRNPYNIVNYALNNNTSSANITSAYVDFLANGFKLRNTGADYNASGGTYIYCAWAENPFQNANAR